VFPVSSFNGQSFFETISTGLYTIEGRTHQMEQLFKQQAADRLDRIGDFVGLSYRAALAVSLLIFTLILALQQVRSAFPAQIACDAGGMIVFVGVFGLLVRARRRSEAFHACNRRQLDIVFEGAPIGIGVLDLDRKVVYCNSEFAKTYGFRKEEIRGVTLPMPESQKIPWADLVDKLRKGQSFVDIPTLRERKDGTRFYASIWGAPLADNLTAPFGLVAVISASKDNFDGPLERRSMELLTQATFDFMCVADLQGRSLFVNEAGIRMNGMRADEAEGTPLLDFFASSDRETISAAIGKAQEGGRLLRGEVRLRHFRSGTPIPTTCKVFVIDDPVTQEPASIACVAEDLSHRKMLEAQLLQTRQALEDILHDSSLGVAFVNTKGQTIDSNEAFRDMLGYSADEVRETPFSTFVHPEDLPTGRGLFLDLAAGKIDFYRINKRLVDKQGNIFQGRMTVRLMRDAEGRPNHTISIVERLRDGFIARPTLGSPELHSSAYN
jgi:PAS domain S-box-containing protein